MNYYCKIVYQYINKYGYYKYFQISLNFYTEFTIFPPENQILDLFSLTS